MNQSQTLQGPELAHWILGEVFPNTEMEGKIELVKKRGGKETDSEVRGNQTDEVMHKNLYGKNSGWSSSLHTRLTCFQIITKKKKKKKKILKTRAVFTLRHTKTRWEVWPHCAAPLKSYFQFSKCVIGLGRGAGLSHGAAGSLSRTLPSLLQRWWTSLALAGSWP